MKYMLMIFQNPAAFETLPKAEQTAVMDEAGAIWKELEETGEWVSGEALFAASTAKAVRTRNGVPAVTDGPYIEAKEQLAGLLIVDVATEERAVEIAGRWPDARFWGMEVRQLIEGPTE
jgi:hypothetical protein